MMAFFRCLGNGLAWALPTSAMLLAACATPQVTTERLQREADEAPAYILSGVLDDAAGSEPEIGPLVPRSIDWQGTPQPNASHSRLALTLSPGDRLRLNVVEGEPFSGVFEVNLDGTLNLPQLPPITVVGLTPPEAEQRLADSLVKARLFQPNFVAVTVSSVRWAPVWVSVSGAVFKPGRALLNQQTLKDERSTTAVPKSGEFAPKRFLSTALKAAGGVRPDADLSAIKLVRRGQVFAFDLSGIFTGKTFQDVALIQHDQIIVHSIDHYQPELIRVSEITPPGFKVYSSKLVVPGPSNSNAFVEETVTISYGTRLLRGLIAANCIGGTQTTNASRYAIMVSTNLITGKVFVIERPIDSLIKDADSVLINPYLMPNDGIACYDSQLTNARDITRALFEFLQPLGMLKALLL